MTGPKDQGNTLVHRHDWVDASHSTKSVAQAHTPCMEPSITSDDLLQGRKAVAISHHGTVYRLQATRLGKLILTK